MSTPEILAYINLFGLVCIVIGWLQGKDDGYAEAKREYNCRRFGKVKRVTLVSFVGVA